MTHPIDLIFLTTSFPKDQNDFSGCFVEQMAYFFAQISERIEIIYPLPHQLRPVHAEFPLYHLNPYYTQSEILNHQGGPDWIESHPFKKWLQIPMLSLGLQMKLLQVLKQRKQTKWIVHWLLPNAIQLAFLKQAGYDLEMVVYVHGGDLALLESLGCADFLAFIIYQASQKLIFVSQSLYHRFYQLLLRYQHQHDFEIQLGKLCTLHMGINAVAVDPLFLRELRISSQSKRFKICTVGRIVKIKGLFLLAQALEILKKEGHRFCWYIAGMGPEQESLMLDLAKRNLQAGEDFIFLGQVQPSQREALLRHCDLFVLASLKLENRTEGMPLSLLEALNAGMNVVCSDQGGVLELFEQDEIPHFIFDITQINTLVDRIRENILDDGLQQYRRQLIKNKEKYYHWDDLWRQHWQLCSCLFD
jgi:glycosyltransferase involved in cell wall biosynthesis